MKIDDLKRGNDIERRLCELEKMQKWLEDDGGKVFLIASGCHITDTISLSNEMRTAILGMCIGERARLLKEFEEL